MRIVLLALSVCLATSMLQPATAQNKDSRDAMIWPQLQVRYITENNNLLFFQNQYRINTNSDFNQVGFAERIQFRLGYEHGFTDHWRGGISERYAYEKFRKVLFSEVYLMHVGKISSVNFIKRVSFEHLLEKERDNSGRFRLFAQIDRHINIADSEWYLIPGVSAEFFIYQDFKEDDPYRWEERVMDRGRLRLSMGIANTDKLTITPFFTRQIDYFVLEPRFDGDGNEISPGGNWNINTPIWGIDLMYTILQDNTKSNRLRNLLRSR